MRLPRPSLRALLILGAVAVVAAVAVPLVLYSRLGPETKEKISWRLTLYSKKLEGQLPSMSWNELWEYTRPDSDFWFGDRIMKGYAVEVSIDTPYRGKDDVKQAEAIFSQRCAPCHGIGGTGGHAPALTKSEFAHGATDLALYRVLRDGIPGTAMVAPDLSFTERWKVVGYLRSLQPDFSVGSIETADARRIDVSAAEIDAAMAQEPIEWLTYSGTRDGHRHVPLKQITRENVSQLKLRWVRQFDITDSKVSGTPLVAGNTLFMTIPPAGIEAIDAKTGKLVWSYQHPLPPNLPICCGRVNRGPALLGDKIFFGTLDGRLVALDASTGRLVWDVEVADPGDGYGITAAPLIAGGAVIIGVSGGEFSIRGMIAAFDPADGKLKWKFDTIPGPGAKGHETWENDAWENGGGPTWVTGSYDPELGLVYWGVGNPSPPFNGDSRPGDNLFTNSVVALKPTTGELVWHFQFTPHDEHDWDSNQTPVLADVEIDGHPRKVICWANRNGFYYVLDRKTGEFLLGVPFVEQNWAKALDAKGRPILAAAATITEKGTFTKPSVTGATNWYPPSYDPERGLFLVHVDEGGSVFVKSSSEKRRRGKFFLGGGAGDGDLIPYVRALDAATGKKVWDYASSPDRESGGLSGLLSTAGGLTFGAASKSVFALDSDTGKQLWNLRLGGETTAPPISYSLDGEQYVAIAVGRSLMAFGL